MRCLFCGKEIPEEKAKIIKAMAIDPLCNEYCQSMYNFDSVYYTQIREVLKGGK
jgi:ribosomal protein S26